MDPHLKETSKKIKRMEKVNSRGQMVLGNHSKLFSSYDGEYLDGEFNGYGIKTFTNGSTYAGYWLKN